MFYRNEVWVGLLTGLIMPAALFWGLLEIFHYLEKAGLASTTGLSPNFRMRTLSIVAIALNLWPMNLYLRRRWELSMRGMVIATAVLAITWVVYFGEAIFS